MRIGRGLGITIAVVTEIYAIGRVVRLVHVVASIGEPGRSTGELLFTAGFIVFQLLGCALLASVGLRAWRRGSVRLFATSESDRARLLLLGLLLVLLSLLFLGAVALAVAAPPDQRGGYIGFAILLGAMVVPVWAVLPLVPRRLRELGRRRTQAE